MVSSSGIDQGGGGNRRFGKLIPPYEIDGIIRQQREQNRKEEDGKRVSGDFPCNGEDRCLYSRDVEGQHPMMLRNPALPDAPEGFGEFDFKHPETRARQLCYAPDEWADKRDDDGQAEFLGSEEATKSEGPETWYRTQDRPLRPAIDQFVLNWLVMNAEMKEWEAGILQALGILDAKDTKRTSQTSLGELTVRQTETHNRTGERISEISWTAVADMGDVSSRQLTIGG